MEEVIASTDPQPLTQEYMKLEKARKYDTTEGPQNSPVTDLSEKAIYKLPEKKFKIMIQMKLSKLEGNINRHLREIVKTIHDVNDTFNKEIDTIK